LTYNIYGAYQPRRFGGEFSINTFSRTESTPEVLREILKEIESLCAAPPTEAELARSRQYLLGSYAAQHETPTAIAQDLWQMESQDLGLSYPQKMFAAISAADANSCHALVKRTIDPRKLVIVVAGNAAAIRKDLRKIAPVRMVSTDASDE
jgi:zinc protease